MAGIYIHIPFCKTRCIYCDFYSTTQSEIKEQYIQAVCKELETRKLYLHGEEVETIYFGGGTPSQLQPADFQQIFDYIYLHYTVSHNPEVTLEANPDDLTPQYLKALRQLPFNRLSIGIQTFNDSTLTLLKRRHTSAQAIHAIEDARSAGFQNISIDLIYGLPGETHEDWKHNLLQAIALRMEHLSAYHLTYEEGTAIYKMRQANQVSEINEEASLLCFQELTTQLSNVGYEHYEISNFCLPDKYSRHNTSYWQGVKYLGCGASAHSFNGDSREWNVASIEAYIKGIEKGERKREIEFLDKSTQYNDRIITGIRTRWGVSLPQLEEDFGTEYLVYAQRNARKYLDSAHLIIKENHLCLTQKGIFISDSIMSDLLWIEE